LANTSIYVAGVAVASFACACGTSVCSVVLTSYASCASITTFNTFAELADVAHCYILASACLTSA